MTAHDPTRREVLKKGAFAGVGAIAAGYLLGITGTAKAMNRSRTPSQTEGPFYPVRDQLDKDADMTTVSGAPASALGQRVRLTGQVFDAITGAPVPGALVEFWQACESGKYNHPNDPNDAPIDPNFQYWAQVRSDANGAFSLLTIKPGAYPANTSWIRPPHIHVKVHSVGYPSLTTQLYFAGEQLNEADQILGRLTRDQRALVVVNFEKNDASGVLEGNWNIYIARFTPGRLLNSTDATEQVTPELD